jgi:ABC-type sugar transport system ATPase subunit
MIEAMLGKELEALERAGGAQADSGGRAVASPGCNGPRRAERLRVEGLASRDGVHDVALTLRAGEIVGLGGLVGSGRSSLVRALAGAAGRASGRMWIDGEEVDPPRNARAAWSHGIALVPEDRKASGLFMALSGRENMMIAGLRRICSAGIVRRERLHDRSEALARDFDVPAGMLDRPAGHLSGGNQQKLLLARAGTCEPRILLADEATRGIDVGAKAVVMQTLRRLADGGMAIVFVSSELEEVAALSDRVYVLREGRIVAHFDGSAAITEDDIVDAAFVEGAAQHV